MIRPAPPKSDFVRQNELWPQFNAWLFSGSKTGCEPTQEIRLFTLASRATRLLRVPSMLPSTAFGLRVRVLAGFGSRPLKDNRKTGPDRNRQGSPKLRLSAIPSPCSARRRFYKVRSVPANPFDNTEKYAPVMAVSLVRNGDNGGGGGKRTRWEN